MSVLVTLKKVRESRGLSQNELARRTGYSLQNIQKIEQNRSLSITFEALEKFCQVLQCQPGDILRWEADKTNDEPAYLVNQSFPPQTDSEQKKNPSPKRTSRDLYKVKEE
ncbi:MAG: helix-turn-helix domain-containing protein [Scytonematopsis contorta HA4267-MV1]|jgi:putative transcriptional regulator|nr:helix-turn-helix domain-containing protein [Scytonematopsis contorta HA4267-MV1]